MLPLSKPARSRRWENPYIQKLSSATDYVLDCGDEEPGAQFKDQLLRRLSAYREIVIELGSGSGGHLIERAKANSDTLFVGFEIRFKRAFRTAEKARALGLKNLLVLRTFAQCAPGLFPVGSVSGIYVLFPDPWGKRRWRKHRLLNDKFFDDFGSILRPGGFFHYRTDHREYFDEVSTTIKNHSLWRVEQASAYESNVEFQSEFEQLFRCQGQELYLCQAKYLGR